MRIKRLYTKIFLSFLGVLVITEILIFALFIFSAGRTFRDRFEQYTHAKVLLLKELVEEKIKSMPGRPVSENESLRDFIHRFETSINASVWLEGPKGNLLIAPSSGQLPEGIERFRRVTSRDYGEFELYYRFKKRSDVYGTIPIALKAGEAGQLNVFFKKLKLPEDHEKGFALGLVIIGVIIALLVIPISRLITGPIKQLGYSALRIAEGDLSHRAEVKTKDEIGELGKSFNHMTERLERMIEGNKELTANISHELRSPLARIRVAQELLREKLKRGDYDQCTSNMEDIREDIEELDRLIGLILDLSKLDIREDTSNFKDFNISDLLTRLVKRLEPISEHRQLTVVTEIASDLSVHADEDSLTTAFSNILDNAAKYTPDKGRIKIKTKIEGPWLKISVTNTFESMTEEDLSRLFDPFYRTSHTAETGTGLGLTITKKIIERHEGTIEAVNTDDGLKIQVTIPIPTGASSAS